MRDKLAFTAGEMAERLGICEKTLVLSDCPRVRVGRRCLFVEDPVRTWLAEKVVRPESPIVSGTED